MGDVTGASGGEGSNRTAGGEAHGAAGDKESALTSSRLDLLKELMGTREAAASYIQEKARCKRHTQRSAR